MSKDCKPWEIVDPRKFRITTENLRALYEKTFEEKEEDPDNQWAPAPAIVDKIRTHFEKRPFDRIMLGVLRIESKKGIAWLEPNQEQAEIMRWIIYCWENKIPCRLIVLKARQIGCSTLCQAVLYAVMCVTAYWKGHLVADLVRKCEEIYQIWRFYYDNEPWWVRPELVKESNPVRMADKRMKKSQCLFESAESREKTGRGFMCHGNHFSEIDFWPEDLCSSIISSLLKAVPDEPNTIVMEESTGRLQESTFHKRFMLAHAGEFGEYKAFFFRWFDHQAYRMPLTRGEAKHYATVEAFFESLNEQDRELWTSNNLEPEQMNWYVTKRKEEMLGDDSTLDIFKREYPSTIEEAFLGSNANFFDMNRVKQDKVRLGAKAGRKIVPLKEVTRVSAPALDDGLPRNYARCSLDCDELNMCRNPKLVDDPLGFIRIFELPRPGMPYVVPADPAKGLPTQKNVIGSQDWDVVEVWRVGYIKGVDAPVFVQAAQARTQGLGPRKAAQVMVALAELYRNPETYQRAFMIPESNAHGMGLIEEAKDLGAGSRMYQREIRGAINEPILKVYGYEMKPGSAGKWALMTAFRQAYERGLYHHNAEISVLELGTFANRNGKLEAVPPNHDDTVVAGALVLEGCRQAYNSIVPVEVEMEILPLDEGYDPSDFRQVEVLDIKKRRARWSGKHEETVEFEI